MNYIPPEDANSPKEHLFLIKVLVHGSEDTLALALIKYDDTFTLGLRWNGDKDRPAGYPQSYGHPSWFVVEEGFFAEQIVSGLKPVDQAFVRNFIAKPKVPPPCPD
jgi:hypothetical protein